MPTSRPIQLMEESRARLIALALALLALPAAVPAQRARAGKRPRNRRPVVTLSVPYQGVKIMCPGVGVISSDTVREMELSASGTDPDGDELQYKFSATGGRVVGTGAQARWLLKDISEGRHVVTVEVNDGRGGRSVASAEVYTYCDSIYLCPVMSIDCPAGEVEEGQTVRFRANVAGGDTRVVAPTYRWTVSAGKIVAGQGTPEIIVETSGVGDRGITATVEVGGYLPECDRNEGCLAKTRRKN